jgi:hypothetical protein
MATTPRAKGRVDHLDVPNGHIVGQGDIERIQDVGGLPARSTVKNHHLVERMYACIRATG